MIPYRGRPGPRGPLPSFYRTDASLGRLLLGMPLGIGLVVFAAFMVASRLGLESLSAALGLGGGLTILIGIVATLAGLGVILTSAASRWSASGARWHEVYTPAIVSIAMLASNFIVAAALAVIANGGSFAPD